MLFKTVKEMTLGKDTYCAHNDDYYKEGEAMFVAGRYTQAMEFFQAEIEKCPDRAEAYLLLADCFVAKGNLQQAKSALFTLLAKDPNNKSAANKLQKIQDLELPTPLPQTASIHNTKKSGKNNSIQNKVRQTASANRGKCPKWKCPTKHIIACIIGIVLFIALVLGIIRYIPVADSHDWDSLDWMFLVEFFLLAGFSICLTLAPRLKPSWKWKNIMFMAVGLFVTPIMVGLMIDDFEANGMMILIAIIGALWTFAPFIEGGKD